MKHRIDKDGNFRIYEVGAFELEERILHLDGEDLDMYLMEGQNLVYLNAEVVEEMYQFIKDVKGEH